MKRKLLTIALAIMLLASSGLPPKEVLAQTDERVPQKATKRTALIGLSGAQTDEGSLMANVIVNPGGQPLNAVLLDLGWPPEMLEFEEADLSASFCKLFIENEADNQSGTYRLSCGLPYPGIIDLSQAVVLKFKIKSFGWTNIELKNSTLALANDGYGTDILKSKANLEILTE